MRFNVELILSNDMIPKDKNRIIMSLLKHNFSSYNRNYYLELYEEKANNMKSFTFALYMGDCKFLRDQIVIPGKRMILNFSTHDVRDGISFYNAFLINKGLEYPIKNNTIKINKISLNQEKIITGNEGIYKTLSPISIREHGGDNRKTWYHSLDNAKGQAVFMHNLEYQLESRFGEDAIFDIGNLEVDVLRNKEVKVKHYDIEVLGNICQLRIKGEPYILDYLYKSGMGSQRSSGFGMVDLI